MGELVIQASGLRKRYGDRVVLDDLSLGVRRGEVLGLLGPNGAGKTTLVECCAGLRACDGGRLRTLGLDPVRDGRALRVRIGVQLQSASLPDRLRVGEALELFAALYPRTADARTRGARANGRAAVTAAPVRVLLVDDHAVVRDGLRAVLEGAGFFVAGEAENGRRALALVASTRPDVVLMDLRMPVLDGVAATRRLRAEHPGVRVLVLTTYDRDADIDRALDAGAVGYLLKDAPRDELARAVHAAARGENVLAPAVAARVIGRLRGPRAGELSDRERDVLRLVAAGRTNREIGELLHVSPATVKTHLLNTFAKLGVDDRTAAVVTALRRGLIELDDESEA